MTAIMICALKDEVETMDFLLKCGAKPDLVNVTEGTTALFLVASKTLSCKAMETLILAQANVDIARLVSFSKHFRCMCNTNFNLDGRDALIGFD